MNGRMLLKFLPEGEAKDLIEIQPDHAFATQRETVPNARVKVPWLATENCDGPFGPAEEFTGEMVPEFFVILLRYKIRLAVFCENWLKIEVFKVFCFTG